MIRACVFDMGRVLVDFCHERMLRQMAEVCRCEPTSLREYLMDSGLLLRYEQGEFSEDQMHALFEEFLGYEILRADLDRAASDIFTEKPEMLDLLHQLRQHGLKLVLLSNTSRNHFEFIRPRFPFVELFDAYVLSYEVKALKPDPAIYHAAVEVAGCRPEECFFTDDIAENIAGAHACGLQAVQFHNRAQLTAALAPLLHPLPLT